MTADPWVTLASRRPVVWLRDGAEAVLIGVPRRGGKGRKPVEVGLSSVGRRARVQFADGRRRTVKLSDIVGYDPPDGAT